MTLAGLRVLAEPVRGFDALGAAWRALEAEAEALPFFRSWTWVGCLAAERYPDPVLLRAEEAGSGRLLGLALFNRAPGGRLHLAESGDPALDRPFIEHNGPLVAAPAGRREAVEAALLCAAWRLGGRPRRLVLGGVPPDLARAAGGLALRCQARDAPWLDLDAVRAAKGDFLATLSANTRYQIRRSQRHYAAEGGGMPPSLARAVTEAERDAWFEAMMALHQASWQRRGQEGAFATPWLRRFHRSLVERAWARGELDLLRIAGGGRAIGYLCNFRLRGRVYAYQSGFDDAAPGPHGKPGLTGHALAVALALSRGDRAYDFLAGAQRYKLSLANRRLPLLWAELVPAWSAMGLAARLRAVARRGAPGLVPGVRGWDSTDAVQQPARELGLY